MTGDDDVGVSLLHELGFGKLDLIVFESTHNIYALDSSGLTAIS